MNKKSYISPVLLRIPVSPAFRLLGASAPDEGIHYGGEGNDDDDPNAKTRDNEDNEWGNLW